MNEVKKAGAAAGLCALVFTLAAIDSRPRRVGDGGEYVVMAERLASFQNPALTQSELSETKAVLRALGGGFEASLLDFPALVGPDGRQSFLHFWLYPLVAVPGVWLSHALNVHPNWAFTFTNIALLAAAAFFVARAAPLICLVYLVAGPIVWWIDKAHTEVFLFAALSIAVASVEWLPAVAILAFALAGAQNVAIGVAYPLFAVGVLAIARRQDRLDARDWIAAAGGMLIVALPFAYNWFRLGRAAPMSDYAHLTMPTLAAISGFVLEPNIGLAAAAPGYLLVATGVLLVLAVKRATPWIVLWPATIVLLLLIMWSQNPNANHGGTPSVNRWTLSLLPLSLPWAVAVFTLSAPAARRAFVLLTVAAAAYSVYWHLPRHPENYLQPTALARALWSRGLVHVTSAEVFAERTAASETPAVPVADARCGVVLVWDLQWPLSCVPPDAAFPRACEGIESFCFAAQHDSRVDVAAASYNGFFFRPGSRSWPASGPLASGVRHVMLSIAPNARFWKETSEHKWVRQKVEVEGLVLLEQPRGLFLYVARTGQRPSLVVRAAVASDATLHTLLPLSEVAKVGVADDTLTPRLPAGASNLALAVRLP